MSSSLELKPESRASPNSTPPSPEIEDILLPHSLVSGVCYIAVG